MMNRAKTFLLILGIAIIGGCASHGKNIQSAFGRDDVNTADMQIKLKWLEAVIAEGKSHEQFRVVKALRYVSKYNSDLEKRKQAVGGLLFISVFSSDSDVRDSAQSRLITIMNDQAEDPALRSVVIDGKKDIVLGRTVYEKNNPSLFTDQVEKRTEYPDEDDREAALLFLINHFEDMEIDLQQHMITAFGQIMDNPQICLEPAEDGCEENDGEDQDEWKKRLGSQINYWAMNNCDWDKEVVPRETKDALQRLIDANPDLIASAQPDCSPYHPVMEDYAVLEMSSIRMPDNYFQFGLDISEGSSNGLHASNLEFGFGNGESFGVVFGVNIDEKWMEPLREKYLTIQYRVKNHKTAIGATRVIRTPDFSLVEQGVNDVDGAINDKSIYVYAVDENELYFTSAFDIESISSHLHLYLGTISQKLAFQYFFRKPDISFIIEGSARSKLKLNDRDTDTVANEDKSERESQASTMRSDILIGAKWNNISLLKGLFIGSQGRDARQGIFNFKLYHSTQREKTYFVVTSPF